MGDLVSVIIPIYNVEKYLQRCIESICNQSYQNTEIILVDDGSTDQSLKLCNEFANKDNRILLIHKANGGLSDARNVGMEHAHGKYIMFVDSDDYVHKDMIKEMYKKITSDASDMVICGYKVVDEEGKEKRGIKYIENNEIIEDEEEYWQKAYDSSTFFYIVAWNKLYKKNIFEGLHYSVGKLHEDEYIIHSLVSRCKKISCIKNKLYYYVQREDSITGKAYTIKRMDIIDALLLRSMYFIDKEYYELALRTMRLCMGSLNTAYKSLDLSSSIVRKEYKKNLSRFKKVYKDIKKKNNISITVVRLNLFCINDKIYYLLCDIFNKIRRMDD